MPVLGPWSYTLEVPELEEGMKFYQDAGLVSSVKGKVAGFRCSGESHDSVVLLGGAPDKKLHHVTLRASELDDIAALVEPQGGRPTSAPPGFDDEGLWIVDPHGMRIHLIERSVGEESQEAPLFEINAPGRIVRKHRSAMGPGHTYGGPAPIRLGHILVFTPDVTESVRFMTEALGMGLADRAQDVIAFCCARRNSDHHVVAFAKSPGVGFHHASFQVADPDEVGRAGRELVSKTGKGDWGFGRHTIGSNFFHYIQDPWGSWLEYYSDMDHIDDYALWTPTNYGMADSLANWGPPVPADFVHNYECPSVN
jgi:catechol 2,3-dioxygenase-like lactoylglutathione lyase family enzyme